MKIDSFVIIMSISSKHEHHNLGMPLSNPFNKIF